MKERESRRRASCGRDARKLEVGKAEEDKRTGKQERGLGPEAHSKNERGWA
jgi:hypothetical protein